MIEQKWGRIITVSSIASLRSLGKNMPMDYGVSKAAVAMLTKLMAVEFADKGITCNCIAIGMIDSPMVRGMLGEYAEAVLAMRDKGSPTGKQGTGWDTANLAAFLASQEANYINGLEMPLDGGLTAKAPDIYPRRSRRARPLTGVRFNLERRHYMGYSLSPLPGQAEFGAVVTGFTPEMLDDPGVRKALYDLWIDKGVIVFRGIEGLDTQLSCPRCSASPRSIRCCAASTCRASTS